MTINEFLERHQYKMPDHAGRILSMTDCYGKIVIVTDTGAIFQIRDAWGELGFVCEAMKL